MLQNIYIIVIAITVRNGRTKKMLQTIRLTLVKSLQGDVIKYRHNCYIGAPYRVVSYGGGLIAIANQPEGGG